MHTFNHIIVWEYVEFRDILAGNHLVGANVCHLQRLSNTGLPATRELLRNHPFGNNRLPETHLIGHEHAFLVPYEQAVMHNIRCGRLKVLEIHQGPLDGALR